MKIKNLLLVAALLPLSTMAATFNNTIQPGQPGYNPSTQNLQQKMQAQQLQQKLKLQSDQQRQQRQIQQQLRQQQNSRQRHQVGENTQQERNANDKVTN